MVDKPGTIKTESGSLTEVSTAKTMPELMEKVMNDGGLDRVDEEKPGPRSLCEKKLVMDMVRSSKPTEEESKTMINST